MNENYISIDIETNGLTPGLHSMISLGAAVINMEEGNIRNAYKWNILPVLDLNIDLATMQWWKQFPEAYKRSTEAAIPASLVIERFLLWLSTWRTENTVLAAWNSPFDLGFIRYYVGRFAKSEQKIWFDTFSKRSVGIDIKMLAAMAMGKSFQSTSTKVVPDWLKLDPNGTPYTPNPAHDAKEDAIVQAYIMYNAARKLGVEI